MGGITEKELHRQQREAKRLRTADLKRRLKHAKLKLKAAEIDCLEFKAQIAWLTKELKA